MAIECECRCGARYTVPNEHAGRRAKCPRCGGTLIIPAAPGGDSEIFALADEPAASKDATRTLAEQQRELLDQDRPKAPKGMAAPPPVVIETRSGFWRDAFHSFNLFCDLDSMFAFATIWFFGILLIGLSIFPLWGIFGIFVYGYVCSYYMNTVTHAAEGNPGLPPMELAGIWWDDMIVPMFQWWGCQLFVLAPAIITAIVLNLYGVAEEIWKPTWAGLALIGMFFWPICVLTVALGGFSMLIRFDRCIVAIGRSPGPYLLICLLLLVAIGPIWGVKVYFYVHRPETLAELLPIGGLTLRVLIVALDTYCTLVCTRLVGLYYHHFKDNFPWAMG